MTAAPRRLHVLQAGTGLPLLTDLNLAPLPASTSSRQLSSDWWQVSVSANSRTPVHRTARKSNARLHRLLAHLTSASPSLDEVLCQIGTQQNGPMTSYSLLELAGITYPVLAAGAIPGTLQPPARVTLVSGVCLFSGRAALALDEHGRAHPITAPRTGRLASAIRNLHLGDQLTVQEEETTLRLASLSSALATCIPAPVSIEQVVDVPCAATMLFLLGHAYNGRLTPRLLAHWCDRVDVRHRCVADLFARRLRQAFSSLVPSRRVQIEIRPQLAAVGEHLRYELTRGRLPQWSSLLELAATTDPLWAQLMALAPPNDPYELAQLSYAATALQAARGQPGQLAPTVVMVDNPAEHKILRYARSYASALSAGPRPLNFGTIAGLYPLPRLLVRARNDRLQHNLYLHDPGRYAVDHRGRLVDLIELATTLYAPRHPALAA